MDAEICTAQIDGSEVFRFAKDTNQLSSPIALRSITKIFTALVFKVANKQIEHVGLETEVRRFVKTPNWNAKTNLGQLLAMNVNMDWKEIDLPYSSPKNSAFDMIRSDDWPSFVLSFQEHETTTFKYNSGLYMLLGGILNNLFSGNFIDFAQKNIFRLFVENEFSWTTHRLDQNQIDTAGGLHLSPLDISKFFSLLQHAFNCQEYNDLDVSYLMPQKSEFIATGKPGWSYGMGWWRVDSLKLCFEKAVPIHLNRQALIGRGQGGKIILWIPELSLSLIWVSCKSNGIGSPFALPNGMLEILSEITNSPL